jgi:peptidyl-prolyl cis-trans isomerase B (cyclophilin B)
VKLTTTKGDIVIELDKAKAPKTVENFLAYVKADFYEGTIFHRVIAGFMIQGGGFGENMREKTTRGPIPNEADNGLKNHRGTIAMARTPDPNSATAQFFINAKDNPFLDFKAKTAAGYGYCVFGKVVEGMDVVDAIEHEPTASRGMYADVPVVPVVIKGAQVMEAPEKKK